MSETTADDYFIEGVQSYAAGDMAAAETAFKKLLEIEPHCAEALINLGNISFHMERKNEAEKYWATAIENNPLAEKAYLNLGNLLYAQGRYEAAIDQWEIFRRLYPDHADVCMNLGLAYEALSRMEEAYKNYRTFTRLNRVMAQTYQVKKRTSYAEKIADHNAQQAERLLQEGKWKEAKEAYEQCIGVYALTPKIYKHYASVLYKSQEWEKAAKWFERALLLMPEDISVLINLAVTYDKQDETFRALWAYASVVKLFGKKAPAEISSRYTAMWSEKVGSAIEKGLSLVKQARSEMCYSRAEHLAKRLLQLCQWADSPVKTEVENIIEILEDRKDPKRRVAEKAYKEAQKLEESGQYHASLLSYDQYLQLMPYGDRSREAANRKIELEKMMKALPSPEPVSAA